MKSVSGDKKPVNVELYYLFQLFGNTSSLNFQFSAQFIELGFLEKGERIFRKTGPR